MIGKGLTVPWKIEHFLADSSKLIEEKENDCNKLSVHSI